MSSRFVSGGTIDAATGEAIAPKAEGTQSTTAEAKAAPSAKDTEIKATATANTTAGAPSQPAVIVGAPPAADAPSARQVEWAAVEKALEEERRRKAEARRAAAAGLEQQSLYDVLQANKAAKQAAFEEASKLKHQFRALDEDEVEFLAGVEAGVRQEEERVRRETEAGLEAFRRAQGGKGGKGGKGDKGDDDDKPGVVAEPDKDSTVDVDWAAARKRKRQERASAFPNLRRKAEKEKEDKDRADRDRARQEKEAHSEKGTASSASALSPLLPPPPKAKPKAGLVAYGSDDDSD